MTSEWALPKEDSREATYHITIESSIDGRILDSTVRGFILVYCDEGGGMHNRARGWSSIYEIVGVMKWASDAACDALHDGDEPAEPLVDEE